MKGKRKKKGLAILLAVCILLSHLGLNSPIVRAEETSEYTVNAVIALKEDTLNIPDKYIEITKKGDSTVISPNTGKYIFEKNEIYAYKIGGAELKETIGEFTASNESAISLSVSKDKLQISYDVPIHVGDEISLNAEELNHDWEWSSTDSTIAEISDKGILKVLKDGTVTITKKSKVDKEFTTSRQFIIEKGTFTCQIQCKIIGEDDLLDVEDENILIEEKNSGKQVPILGGNCELKYGTGYKCSFSETGITGTEKEFTTPSKGNDVTDYIMQLEGNLTIPVLKVGDKELGEESIVLKKDEQVSAICSNEVWDKENWKIVINDGAPQSLDNIVLHGETSQNQVVFYYKDKIFPPKEFNLSLFDKYEAMVRFHGKDFIKPESCTFLDKYGNTITLQELESGEEYTVNTLILRGFTYEKDSKRITPTVTENTIYLEPTDIVRPEICIEDSGQTAQQIEKIYGETVDVKVTNVDALYNLEDWAWECTLEDDENKKLETIGSDIEKTSIVLNGDIGTYNLKLKHKDMAEYESNVVTITESKIQLDFAKENEKNRIVIDAGTKTYDGNKVITVECPVSNIDIEKINGTTVNYSGNLYITGEIQGEVNACTTQEKMLKVTKVEVRGDENYKNQYDVSKLNGQTIKISIAINKAEILVVLNEEVKLSYRSHVIRWEKIEDIILKNVNGRDIIDAAPYIKLLDENIKATDLIIDDDKAVCTIKSLKAASTTLGVKPYTISNAENITFIFENNIFNYEEVSEVINSLEVESNICMTQGVKNRELNLTAVTGKPDAGQWINGDAIKTDIVGTNFIDAYQSVYYNKIPGLETAIHEVKSTAGLLDKLEPQFNEGENISYYELIFADAKKQYPTVAALIRIIKEPENDGVPYNTSYELEGQQYTVINLFYDDTAGVVSFEELGGLEKKENNFVQLEKCSKNKEDIIAFRIENKGVDIKEPVCGFIKCDTTNGSVDCNNLDTNNMLITAAEKSIEEEGVYSVQVPEKEGDYILYVKTENGLGTSSEYVSNGFFIDNTKPTVTARLRKQDNTEEIDIAEQEENRCYLDKECEVNVEVEEAHLDNVEFSITAKDFEGNSITEGLPNTMELQKTLMKSYRQDQDNSNKAFVTITIEKDGNYILEIKATDKAGLTNDQAIYYFTIDKSRPETGMITLKGTFRDIKDNDNKKKGIIETIAKTLLKTWNTFFETVTYKLFSEKEVEIKLEGKDSISPVKIYYYIADAKLTEEQLVKMDEKDWIAYGKDSVPKIKANQKKLVYEKVEDAAGNSSYFNSEGIITDNMKPTIAVTYKEQANKQGFYHSNVTFSARVEDKTRSPDEAVSGLQMVAYRIEKDGVIVQSDVVYEASEKKAGIEEKEFTATIKAEDSNSNNVVVYITAVDCAGNQYVKKEKLQIDVTKPEIIVSYDNNNGLAGKYYNQQRTATITIKERNLNTDDTKISVKSADGSRASIGKWTHDSNVGKSDDATYTCKVLFSEDDAYQFSVSCVDKAGNKANNNFSDAFTVDATKPIISVNYNGGTPQQNAYYNEAVTATITITEHNFDVEKVNIQTRTGTANNNGVSQGVSGFSSNGDIHTATIQFGTDGEYGLDVAYADKAGNQADSVHGNSFTVDLTEPELKITNLDDKSANKDGVQPIVTCTDANYDGSKVSITIRGANGGEIDLKNVGYAASNIENGQQFTMDFPKTEELDDVYKMTAKMLDKAGNEKESSIEFSVNRYGSVYTLGTETGKWLTNGECAYIKEGKPIVIIETNVDEIVEQNISYTAGGIDASVVSIKEADKCSLEEKEAGAYFKASKLNTNNQWYQYRYEVNADNFTKEGRYTIQIDSADKAGNSTSNVSNKHSDSNLQVQFAIDQTAPSIVVSGAENGAIYNEDKHTVFLDVQDNLAINYVTVYLNDEEYRTYKAADIEKMENGLIPVAVEQSLSLQKLQIKAVDMAGNVVSDKADGTFDKNFGDFKILVTRNLFVQFFHTTWLLVIFLLVIACGIGGTMIVIKRRKK